jgi:serine/threonine-protein kinase HipA
MVLLANLGMTVAETEILDFEDVRALSVRRFDRAWGGKDRLLRQSQEDCLQALGVPPTRKHEAEGGPGIPAIMRLLSGSDRALEDQTTFLKAQICYWLMGATDGHAKNFSIFLAAGGRFILTPLYDIMSSEPYYRAKQIPKNQMKLAMCLGTNRRYRMDMITTRHFEQTASISGISPALVRQCLDNIAETWNKARDKTMELVGNSVPDKISAPILDGFSRRLKEVA